MRIVSAVVTITLTLVAPTPASAALPRDPAVPSIDADRADPGPPSLEGDLAALGWIWPVSPFRLEAPYVQPPHRYGAGHRGIDLEPIGETGIVAPAGGTVAFSGSVAGRGILTIDHGDGLVTTLEPVSSTLLAGAPVERGDLVAEAAIGGHAPPGSVHFGVRLHGEYINPLLLLGGVPRAVLLPCC